MPYFLILAALAACRPDEAQMEIVIQDSDFVSTPQRASAPIEAMEIFQGETFPVEVEVIVRGNLPNECTTIDQISQERRGGTFFIEIDSIEYESADCSENRLPFEESIALDLVDLPAGIYVVDVNGLQGTFKLQRDNIRDDGNAVVGGLVWYDRCQLVNSGGDGDLKAATECVDFGDGRYGGDGIRSETDGGIGGVKVHLGAGVCPSTGLATTLTAPDGTFLFSGLTAGDYCLTGIVDEQLGSIIGGEGEGLWTFPAGASGQRTVSLQPGDSDLETSFGWTRVQTEVAPVLFTTPEADCSNKALFISDITVPDDTRFLPGETFTKTWQLQNLGSCTWEPDYRLVFAAGDRMSAPETVPVTITVPPGDFAEISIRLVAPEIPGEYRGEWILADAAGTPFGIGPGSDRPFWVRIVVVEESAVG